ncbi:hypothetical protein [Pseudobacteriovorax antillogorgiicola]|uniref:Outer membrane protein beta-barrel domain-containing protein n=1 Tax=Pseudobacteriovorax antillogorgiicola TaxID=1513793 RepID=A0A1Y6BDB8_9BACT|nr:hypothetical protein [Pseudobacteriovorax antillogorgiicola]TCS56442.1 hypothetical protein EDD56_104264 [Pseudobacteriovorax antillogorgiicola]SMF05408.1 hypothetical protein SAMN06296036_10469 [Pseudobacteriovorax antillogorgiicola]
MNLTIKRLVMTLSLLVGLACANPAIASIGLGLNAGLGVLPVPTMGADIFYDMGQITVGAHYAAGSGDFSDIADVGSADISVEKLEADVSLMTIDARFFLIFGMNFFAGVGQRTVDFAYSLRDSSLGAEANGTIETKSTITKAGFGTMGRFGVFYIGFDLAAVHAAASGSASTSTTTNIPAAASELQNQLDDLQNFAENDVAKGTTVGVAILSIGALL